MAAWERWRVVCLAALSVEDVEDIYLFGTVITTSLLIGIGTGLVYQRIRESMAAAKSPTWLPGMIEAVRVMGTQTVALHRNVDNLSRDVGTIKETLMALQRKVDRIADQNGQRE